MFALDAPLLVTLAVILALAATWEPRRTGRTGRTGRTDPIDLAREGRIPPSPAAGRS